MRHNRPARRCAGLKQCLKAQTRKDQALFGIVQGSVFADLREMCAREMVAMDFPGYAIGGVSVGEGLELLKKVVAMTAPFLPENKPRYLMGVGLPEDILESVERGMDMFDCVIPTRYARSATLFTRRGRDPPHQQELPARLLPHRSELRLLRLHQLQPGIHPPPFQRQ